MSLKSECRADCGQNWSFLNRTRFDIESVHSAESEKNEDNGSEAETVQIESTTESNIEANDVREPTASESQSEDEEEAIMTSTVSISTETVSI